MKFNERLKKFRLRAELSQAEVARRVGVSDSTYRAWEYGSTILGEPYPRIAKAFNITLDELFGVNDAPRSSAEDFDKIIAELHHLKSKFSK